MSIGEYSCNFRTTNEGSESTLSCSFSSQAFYAADLLLKQSLVECRETQPSFKADIVIS